NLADRLDILGTLGRLRGIYYNWDVSNSAANGLGTQREIGMAAQEVQAVLPELVGQNASGYLSLDYPKMTAYLVEVAKVQQGQIEELKYTLNGFGLLNSTSTIDMAVFHAGGLGAMIQAALQSLGMALQDGVATLKGLVAKSVNTDQMTTKQMCVTDSGNNDICLTGDQLKELINKAGSSMTINQTFQAPVVPISNSTTTAP
ncbi:MAG: tail fiber domain-containing protein, partial [Candidatus Paceibacterota bacterium]